MASIDFINECKERAYKNRFGRITINENNTVLTGSDKLQSLAIDSGCYVDGNIVGTIYSKKLEASFLDSLDVDFIDNSITTEVGVRFENDEEEYIPLGKYFIEKPKDETTMNSTSIVAYDELINNLDKPYVCFLDYENETITLADLYNDLCTNLELTPKTLFFTNSDFVIESNPFVNNESNRLVLQSILKVSCSYVEIDNDSNEIDLAWLSDSVEPEYEFRKDDYSEVNGGKITFGPVNTVIIQLTNVEAENVSISDDDSIALYGEHQFKISDDYILNDADKRDRALPAIWEKVRGLKYVDYELTTYYGKPFLNIGSKIRIYTSDTEYFDSYVLNHKFTFDGTFTSVLKGQVLTNQEVATKQDTSLGQLLRDTQILVDKANAIISFQITDTYTKTEIQEIAAGVFEEVKVSFVANNMGNFTNEGLRIQLEDTMDRNKILSDTSSLFNDVGITVQRVQNNAISSGNPILFAGYVKNDSQYYTQYKGQSIVATENIVVNKYAVFGELSRIEDYTDNGIRKTGMFPLGE